MRHCRCLHSQWKNVIYKTGNQLIFNRFALEMMFVVCWFNFVLNLNNYRFSLGQHFWGSFYYLHKSLQMVEAGYDQDNLLVSPGQRRVIYGLLRASDEDNFCKWTKNPQQLVHCNCCLLVILELLIVTNDYIC